MPLFVSNLSVPFDTPLESVYAMARTKAKLPEAVSAFPYVVKVSGLTFPARIWSSGPPQGTIPLSAFTPRPGLSSRFTGPCL